MNIKIFNLLLLFLVIGSNIAAWYLMSRPLSAPDQQRKLQGVCYAPYGSQDNPVTGQMLDSAGIDRDMALLSGVAGRIRLYSSRGDMAKIPAIAEKYGLAVTAGAWLDKNLKDNDDEVKSLISLTRKAGNVTSVLAGNETLLRNALDADQLISYLRDARRSLSLPVSTAEPWHVWLANPRLVAEVDFIAVHLLPYWENIPLAEALPYILSRLAELHARYPGKEIVLTEIGWPTHGRSRFAATPSLTGQALFLRNFLDSAAKEGIDYNIMEAFDQPWKRYLSFGEAESAWGIFTAERKQKFTFTGAIRQNPLWPLTAIFTSLMALPVMIFFLKRWEDIRPWGRFYFLALLQACATTLFYCVSTAIPPYPDGTDIFIIVALVLFLCLLFAVLAVEGLQFTLILAGNCKRRYAPANVDTSTPEALLPMVSIHVPIHNEPPEMVKKTVQALARLDYPNFEVIVIDNNTADESLWRPVKEFCLLLGPSFRFFHVSPLAGFKAGALNFAMSHTDERARIIAVLDSDYVVSTDWLKSLVPLFEDPSIGLIQCPQANRDWQGHAFKTFMNGEYAGFFQIGMVLRNEDNAIIQHGTMSLVRRTALEQAGPWGEWCICEDAEMGLRLLAAGWRSIYINHCFGHGLVPDHFAGYKIQRFRWAYGAMQILKNHWRWWLPGSPLTRSQRYHFVSGWLPWISDAAGFLLSLLGILWMAGFSLAPRYFTLPVAQMMVPALIIFPVRYIQYFLAAKLTTGSRWRDCIGAGVAGLSLNYTIARAVISAVFTRSRPFQRTPKGIPGGRFLGILAMAREEIFFSILLASAGVVALGIQGGEDPASGIWALIFFIQAFGLSSAPAMVAVDLISGSRQSYHKEQI